MLPAFICKYRAKNFVYSAVYYAVQCTTLFVSGAEGSGKQLPKTCVEQ
jgi:hypothetical protein